MESKTSGPTVAEKFHLCRFAGPKEIVPQLPAHVCGAIMEAMPFERATVCPSSQPA